MSWPLPLYSLDVSRTVRIVAVAFLLLCAGTVAPATATAETGSGVTPHARDDAAVRTDATDGSDSLSVNGTALGNVFGTATGASFDVRSEADTVAWTVTNYTGATVATNRRSVPESGSFTLSPSLDDEGYFELRVTARSGGSTTATTRRAFAILEPHEFGSTDDRFFAMSGHMPAWDSGAIDIAKRAGVRAFRGNHVWAAVEQEKGVYDPPRWVSNQFTIPEANGMEAMAGIWFGNERYIQPWYGKHTAPYTDAQREAYADYAAAVVTEMPYSDQLDSVEIWNEYNVDGRFTRGPAAGDAQNYTKLLRTAYPVVKEARSDVTVLGIGNGWHEYDFFLNAMRAGALQYLDVVSVHPYRRSYSPEDREAEHGIGNFEQEMRHVQDLTAEYPGGQKPVWITEFGYSTEGGTAVSARTQAQWAVRSHVMARAAGIPRLYWYEFYEHGGAGYGFIRGKDDPMGAYAPKPSFAAYATMTRELTGSSFAGKDDVTAKRLDESVRDVYSYAFEKDGERRRVMWSLAEATVTVETDRSLTIVDTVGNERTVEPSGGTIDLTLSEDPIYVHGPVDGVTARVPTSFILDGTITGVESTADGGAVGLDLHSTAENTPLSVESAQWRLGERSGTASVSKTVRPGGNASVTVPVKTGRPWKTEHAEITLHFADRPSLTIAGNVSANPVYRRSHTVDADLGEVTGTPAIRLPEYGTVQMDEYSGRSDLSGSVWLTYDEEYLYLSARLTDDAHARGWPLWKHDSIQFGVSEGRPTTERIYPEITIGHPPAGARVFRQYQPEGPKAKQLPGGTVAIERRDGRTVYEVAMPWEEINASPEETLSVSVAVNDNDTAGRKGWIEWAGGIGSGKDTTQFRTIQLREDAPPTGTPETDPATGQGDDTSTRTAGGNDPTDRASPRSGTSGPGMGALAAVVALTIAAVWRRYRR